MTSFPGVVHCVCFESRGMGKEVVKSILQVGPDWMGCVLSSPPDLLWKLFIERLCKYDESAQGR